MVKVLVTGGAGYIGSHCVKALLERGYQVVVADNLATGFEFLVSNVSKALGRHIPFYRMEAGSRDEMRALLEKEDIEGVFHFAGSSVVPESQRNPLKYYSNNTAQSLMLLEAMALAGVRDIVFSSTASVYGEAQRIPIDESHPIAPISNYGKSKRLIEEVILAASEAHGLRHAILRYFNVAGADRSCVVGECHDPETHLVPLVLKAALGLAERFAITGTDYPTEDGTNIRDYVHINDLVRAHLMAFEWMRSTGGSGVFNLSSEKGYSVRQVVDTVRQVTGRSFRVDEAPRRAGDPPTLIASSQAIERSLGWRPQLGLEDMVATAFAWMQKMAAGTHVLS